MTKDEARELTFLFANVNGYEALCKYVQNRIENIKGQLLTCSIEEVHGLQQSASELKKFLSLREKAKQVLEAKDGN